MEKLNEINKLTQLWKDGVTQAELLRKETIGDIAESDENSSFHSEEEDSDDESQESDSQQSESEELFDDSEENEDDAKLVFTGNPFEFD